MLKKKVSSSYFSIKCNWILLSLFFNADIKNSVFLVSSPIHLISLNHPTYKTRASEIPDRKSLIISGTQTITYLIR